MRILGIDPGSVIIGYAIFNNGSLLEFGKLKLKGHQWERAFKAYDFVFNVVERFGIDEVAMEKIFYGKNVSSLIKLAEARGAILAALGACGIGVFEYHPSEIKKALTGNGSASKEQIIWMVKNLFSLTQVSEDEADAIAVAYCHVSMRGC